MMARITRRYTLTFVRWMYWYTTTFIQTCHVMTIIDQIGTLRTSTIFGTVAVIMCAVQRNTDTWKGQAHTYIGILMFISLYHHRNMYWVCMVQFWHHIWPLWNPVGINKNILRDVEAGWYKYPNFDMVSMHHKLSWRCCNGFQWYLNLNSSVERKGSGMRDLRRYIQVCQQYSLHFAKLAKRQRTWWCGSSCCWGN